MSWRTCGRVLERHKDPSAPSPPALPLLGCLPQMMRWGGPTYFRRCAAKYGPVFKVAFGRTWMVVVADADLMRSLGYRLRNHIIIEPELMRPHITQIDKAGLFRAKYVRPWTTTGAWSAPRGSPPSPPPPSPATCPAWVSCAAQLAGRLEAMAAESGQGGRVDIWRELGSMTLQVVGSTAYGVDFLAPTDEHGNGSTAALGSAAAAGGGAAAKAARAGKAGARAAEPPASEGRLLMQEAKVALALLYQRLRFELEAGQVPLLTAAALTLGPRDGLWVRPVARAQRRPPGAAAP
ncbi:hypothetical protein TSOC_008593 [Tetrabaena socialis]|uniref:Uncharacterized protein n=1 Tax=Tetrabaena socialis TaxID=47790 RepID=A0A2J7ZY37_9CHLO|nr:hypothetical protein TSOC_008593 [Tetrabaena socialis]|eukprot:PNH05176.1 hypothetical protein TSOC_008593 [Tetrabaena socialis]